MPKTNAFIHKLLENQAASDRTYLMSQSGEYFDIKIILQIEEFLYIFD